MERFRELKLLGRGNYGSAILVEELETGERMVIKKIALSEMSDAEREQAKQEVVLLSSLKNACIVKYMGSFIQDNHLHICMEYCAGGDLASKIKAARKAKRYFTEEQVTDWFTQLALAVSYIHSRHVLHRDLKSQNVFLTAANTVRLGDFGIARVLEHTLDQAKTVVGTPYFMAPEICEGKQYSQRADMWALGCVLYEMCTLQHAFQSNNLLGLVYKIVQEKQPPLPSHYSKNLVDLVDALLSKDPGARLEADQVLQLPFIAERVAKLASKDDTTAGLTSPVTRPLPRAGTQAPHTVTVPAAAPSEDAEGAASARSYDDETFESTTSAAAAPAPGPAPAARVAVSPVTSPVHSRAGAAVVDMRRPAPDAQPSAKGGVARQASGFSDASGRRASADSGYSHMREAMQSKLSPLETGGDGAAPRAQAPAMLPPGVSPRLDSISARFRAQQASAAVSAPQPTPTSGGAAGGVYMYRPQVNASGSVVKSPQQSPLTSADSGGSTATASFDAAAPRRGPEAATPQRYSAAATPATTPSHAGASSRPDSAGSALPVVRTPHGGVRQQPFANAGMQVLSPGIHSRPGSFGSAFPSSSPPPEYTGLQSASSTPSRPSSGGGYAAGGGLVSPSNGARPVLQRVSRKSRPGAVSAGGIPLPDPASGIRVMQADIDAPPPRPWTVAEAPRQDPAPARLVRESSAPPEEVDEDVASEPNHDRTLDMPPAQLLPRAYPKTVVHTPAGTALASKPRSLDEQDVVAPGRTHLGDTVVHLGARAGRASASAATPHGAALPTAARTPSFARPDDDPYAEAKSGASAAHAVAAPAPPRINRYGSLDEQLQRHGARAPPAGGARHASWEPPRAAAVADDDDYSYDFNDDDIDGALAGDDAGAVQRAVHGILGADVSDPLTLERDAASLASLQALAQSHMQMPHSVSSSTSASMDTRGGASASRSYASPTASDADAASSSAANSVFSRAAVERRRRKLRELFGPVRFDAIYEFLVKKHADAMAAPGADRGAYSTSIAADRAAVRSKLMQLCDGDKTLLSACEEVSQLVFIESAVEENEAKMAAATGAPAHHTHSHVHASARAAPGGAIYAATPSSAAGLRTHAQGLGHSHSASASGSATPATAASLPQRTSLPHTHAHTPGTRAHARSPTATASAVGAARY